jgi:DNA-binding PadR family transcriptional regulator
MAATNRTTFAILGLLAIEPKSGYDIKRAVEISIGHFWKESFGHIYPMLARLEAQGLIEPVATEAPLGRTERQSYRITEQGRAALREWLAEPVMPVVTRNELALKLFFGAYAPVDVHRRHIQEYQAHHLHALEQYRVIQTRLEQTARATDLSLTYRLLTVRMGIHYCQGVLAWCEEALERLKEER